MKYDIVIIGAGPAGYVAAIRAGQVGLKTALIEKKYVGGMCLNWGCIPTKAMIESGKMFSRVIGASEFGVDGIDKNQLKFNWDKAKKRAMKIVKKLTGGVEFLLKKNGVDVIMGEAVIHDNKTITVDNRSIECDNIIIATGSYPDAIQSPIEAQHIIHLEKLFDLPDLPKNIVVYGKGAVAVELVQFLHMIEKNVSLVTPGENIIPGADSYLSDYIIKKFHALNIPVVYSDTMDSCADGLLHIGDNMLQCDKILNCSFRKAILPKSDVSIALDDNGYIQTNDKLETSVPGIYAVGDVNGRSYLAHVASAQGIWVVNKIKGVKGDFNSKNFPLNIYTHPEMAQIGHTEQDLQQEGIEYKLSEFPLSVNGKAMTEGNTEGLIRMFSDKKYGQVLGVQIIADHATDMIAEAAAYMQIEGTIYDISQTIHAHPTVSEIFMEAGFEAVDRAIHT
ncbi:MAG: dihydrolipoyl dehydrogenase [Bacteroidota bacterium]